MFECFYLRHFSTDLQKIGDSWKDLEHIFKMGPIWHFQLDLLKSYKQNKVDCPKNGKIQRPVPHEGKKCEYFKKRPRKYFGVVWDGPYMCLTTRNHEESGSYPSLMFTVEIQSSAKRPDHRRRRRRRRRKFLKCVKAKSHRPLGGRCPNREKRKFGENITFGSNKS